MGRLLASTSPPRSAILVLRALGAVGVALAVAALALDATARTVGSGALFAAPLGGVLALYLAAHALRAARTVIVLGEGARSVRRVLVAHLTSAPWTGLLPYKLGDLVRMWAIGKASDGFGEGLRVVWIERTFDAVLIGLAAAVVVVLRPSAAPEVAPIAIASVLLLGVTATTVVALPENVGTAKQWLLGRYTARWSNRLLALLDAVGDAMIGLRRMVRGKIATLLLVSVAIWALEVAALHLLTRAEGLEELLVGFLGVLSGVLEMGPEGSARAGGWRLVVVVGCAAMAFAGALLPLKRRPR